MWERAKAVMSHSTFWLGLCSIVLNLAPYCSAELADYPEAMRWIRIGTAAAWMLWLYLKGQLPDPMPPAPKAVCSACPPARK